MPKTLVVTPTYNERDNLSVRAHVREVILLREVVRDLSGEHRRHDRRCPKGVVWKLRAEALRNKL